MSLMNGECVNENPRNSLDVLITHPKNCKRLRDALREGGWLDRSRKVEKRGDHEIIIPIETGTPIDALLSRLSFDVQRDNMQLPSVQGERHNCGSRLAAALKSLAEERGCSWTRKMQEECERLGWERHGDMLVMSDGALQGADWNAMHDSALWSVVAEILSTKKLAVNYRINNDDFRSPRVKILLGSAEDPWVTHVDNHIKYSFDITRCMFSSGNINEKLRISRMDCSQQIVVDMFAGIGYFTLPYLVHAKAKFVHACEWNPHAVDALRRNLQQNGVADKCQIHQGDNRKVAPVGVAQRVNMGLIPSCEQSWRASCAALNPDTGGFLHVHENVTCSKGKDGKVTAYLETGNRIRDAIQNIFNELSENEQKGRKWQVSVEQVLKVKSYAPRIHHVVCDIKCKSGF